MAHPVSLETEAAETPVVAQQQIERAGPIFQKLGEQIRAFSPHFVVTCARGSSDHASTYGKYLIETQVGKAVASIGPSIASVYDTALDLTGALFIVVSQSGKSPDILKLTARAREAGALTVGFINDENSPLFQSCDIAVPLCAGKEQSVAATKSYILSAFAYLQLVAYWKQDKALLHTVHQAPDLFAKACQLDWRKPLLQLEHDSNMFTIGRGLGLGLATEVALKMKEVCGLHAEAFSSAEVIHGPLALARPGFSTLVFGQKDEAETSLLETEQRFLKTGAKILSTLPVDGAIPLPALHENALLEPLCQALSFYSAISSLARKRGLDPEKPPHLSKITETV